MFLLADELKGYKAELWKANQDPEFKDETFCHFLHHSSCCHGDLRKPDLAHIEINSHFRRRLEVKKSEKAHRLMMLRDCVQSNQDLRGDDVSSVFLSLTL